MGINFIYDKVLILLIPVIFLIIWIYNRYRGIVTKRDRLIVIVRCIIMSLIILSLAGMELVKTSKETSLVYVVDRSNSIREEKSSIDEFILKSLEHKTEPFKVGIVTFGKEGLVEHPLDGDVLFSKIETTPEPDFTNIESGLKLAYGLMAPNTNKRIVLITDGDQNIGDALSYAKTLARQGVTIDGYYISSHGEGDMQISSVELPGMLYQGEEYDIRVVIDSTVSMKEVPLKLYADRELIGEQRVDVRKGENIFLFKHRTDKRGIIGYEAQIDIDDENTNNNSMAGFTYVEGKPLIGVVEGKKGNGSEISSVLDAGGIDYRLIDVNAFPQTLDDLRRYSGLIFVDVSLEDMDENRQIIVENFVGSLGRGLIVIGGDNSYALGGYGGSTLEKILPLSMDISSKAHIPSLALMLVIDRSGSMMEGQGGITKLDLAKEAAIRSWEALRPIDTIGVVAFDTQASWVVEPVVAKDKKAIEEKIGTLVPGGGTDMYPGLNEAYNALLKTDAKLKHIIALTDGQSLPAPYGEILEKFEDAGITLSAVAVGEDADRAFLQDLARRGRGRYYFTDEFRTIPKIFTKETYIAAESYVQNRTFSPVVTSTSPLLSNIDALPTLDGYLTTTPKPRADMVLVSDKDDPILASWQYGLGKVVAWTSDFEGMWTGDLLGTDQGGRLWLNALSYILPSSNSEDFKVETRRQGDKGEILVDLQDSQSEMEGRAVVVSPDGSRQEIDLEALRPGQYGGVFDIGPQGIYAINVVNSEDGVITGSVDTALPVSYSPEYDIRDRQGYAFLERLTKEVGGQMLEDPSDVFRYEDAKIRRGENMTPYLLPIILILFIFDIGLRRVNLGFSKKKRRQKPILKRKDKVESKKDETGGGFTEALLKAREGRRKF